jgi:hypothetical protein
MAKIVVLELGFEDEEDAIDFVGAIESRNQEGNETVFDNYSLIKCRVDDVDDVDDV